MLGKVHQTRQEKFEQSLECKTDDDNRPFIRVKEDKEADRIIYLKKSMKIEEEKRMVANVSGDSLDNINLIDPWGQVYSNQKNIRDFKIF